MSQILLCRLLRRPLVVWLAVLIAVFGAVAPSVSYALARNGALGGVEVCTSTGTQIIPADSPAGPETALPVKHCPFCLQSTDRIAPPPSLIAHLFLTRDGQQGGAVWQAFFFDVSFFLAAAPRGPPAACFSL